MSAHHTPGPWKQGSDHYQVEARDGTLICNLSGWKGPKTTEANARLIAAAPELYEAGKRVTDAFRAMGNAAGIVEVRDARIECEQAMLTLDAALSKATRGAK